MSGHKTRRAAMAAFALALCSCSLLLSSSDEDCVAPDDGCEAFRCDGFDGCYIVCEETVEQPTAAAVCDGWDFSLMTVDSAGLDRCLDDARQTDDPVWIGLTQAAGAITLEGDWSWPGGADLDGYENWDDNEPNDQQGIETGIEQCVEKETDGFNGGTWNDLPCDFQNAFACERNSRSR